MENRKSKSSNIVLDSFALLAYFGDEKGRNYIETLLKDALGKECFLYMTNINLGEVIKNCQENPDACAGDELAKNHLRFNECFSKLYNS